MVAFWFTPILTFLGKKGVCVVGVWLYVKSKLLSLSSLPTNSTARKCMQPRSPPAPPDLGQGPKGLTNILPPAGGLKVWELGRRREGRTRGKDEEAKRSQLQRALRPVAIGSILWHEAVSACVGDSEPSNKSTINLFSPKRRMAVISIDINPTLSAVRA